MTRASMLVVAVAGLGLHGAAEAATILVPNDYPTIQDAINNSTNGDEIIVAPGVYVGLVNYDDKAVVVRSSDGPAVTTINALGLGTAVTVEMGQGNETVLDGFTVTGGTGTTFGVRTGGGGFVAYTSDPTVRNCIFLGNTADDGGGAFCFVGNPKFGNCTFILNSATGFQGKGGAIYCDFGSPLLTNCTITDNTAFSGGGIYVTSPPTGGGAPRLINSINYGNSGGAFAGGVGSIATYSCIQGGFSGAGNINADPLFTNAAAGDLTLQAGSPCIDRGDSSAVAMDFPVDLGGDQRGVDDPLSPDQGIAVFGLTVDMGAYEFQVADCDPPTCPADLDSSGDVGFGDILQIIGAWGVCPP
ncbi:MAG: hypothetical protein GY715_02470 [Planctomycetes bacterium]|nr:hypothetical protein [Planctomycetota bacterium]